MASISDTLAQRQKTHGDFSQQSATCQALKSVLRASEGWENMTNMQREALEMICHKIARIINGNPNFHDTWHDISGYATLVENTLEA